MLRRSTRNALTLTALLGLSGCVSAEDDLFFDARAPSEDKDDPAALAAPDKAQTRSGVAILIDVMANDAAAALPKTLRLEDLSESGQATIREGALAFMPPEDFVGRVSLAYSVADTQGRRSPPTPVEVIVRPSAVEMPLTITAGQTRRARLWLEGGGRSADTLTLSVHRPAYSDPRTQRELGPKVLVRLNGGAWIGATSQSARCEAPGCLDSALTARFSLPLATFGEPGPQDGLNELAFRMPASDGRSTSYRVLAIEVSARDGQSALEEGDLIARDPSRRGGDPANSSIRAGERLWRAPTPRALFDAQRDLPLMSGCGGCHEREGRDLAYYHFSRDSIRARAALYNLTEAQAASIADYIDHLARSMPASEKRRPWNPPFQPGPSIDGAPANLWAAGAGLDAVLRADEETLSRIVIDNPGASAPRLAIDRPARAIPIAMQLPDWQAWLPELHPSQIFGDQFDDRELGAQAGYLALHYEQTRDAFAAEDRSAGREALENFTKRGHGLAFVIAGPADWTDLDPQGEARAWLDEGELVARQKDGSLLRTPREAAARAIRHWVAVKLWEIHQAFDLASSPPPPAARPYERRWWGAQNAIGLLAPQRTALEAGIYADRSASTSRLRSMQFNHLQLVLNSAPVEGSTPLRPVDWRQHLTNINRGFLRGAVPPQPARAALVLGAMYRAHAELDPSDEGFSFELLHPGRLAPDGGYQGQIFYTLPAATRTRVLGAILASLMDVLEPIPPASWGRQDGAGLEPLDYVPRDLGEDANLSDALIERRFADAWWTMIPRFADVGVPHETIERLIAFGQKTWPAGDWSALSRS